MQLISNYPWYYTLLCLVAGFVFSAILYFRDKHHAGRSKTLRVGLAVLRFASVSLICFLLLDIFIKRVINETEKPIIIFAQDNSSSIIASKDSSFIKNSYLPGLKNFISHIQDKYEVKNYTFDSESRPSADYHFDGKETNMSQLFSDIENNYANKNIGAVIIASDGIYNRGTNPVYRTDRLNTPIYTIALGDTTPLKDVWIQSINHNQVAYLGNDFPIEVIVNAVDLKGKTVSLAVSQNGQSLKSQPLVLSSDNFSQASTFFIEAKTSGIQKYTVSLSVPGEDNNKQNNTQTVIVDVIDNREKILILANAPHPDVAALEQSISASQTYEVETDLISQFSKPLKPYSLIIFHQTGTIPQAMVNELKNNHQSVFVIGNNMSVFLSGLNHKTASDSRTNDVEAHYKKDFSLFSISQELQNYFKNFPAVKCAFKPTAIANGLNSLLTQKIGVVETEEPLMTFTENNGMKLCSFTGDGLWRWRLRDFADHDNHQLFDELIHKTVQYLSVKSDKSFFRVYSKKIIYENEPLDFTAEVYNQSYELITEPDVSLTLKDFNQKTYNYTFSKKQNMYQLSAGLFPPGEYRYEAKVKYGNQFYSKSGIIIIKEIVLEKINAVANHQLLYQLSHESSGKLYYPSQLNQLQDHILASENIKPITYSSKQLSNLIHLKWLFFVILIFLSAEWFLRKYNGKV